MPVSGHQCASRCRTTRTCVSPVCTHHYGDLVIVKASRALRHEPRCRAMCCAGERPTNPKWVSMTIAFRAVMLLLIQQAPRCLHWLVPATGPLLSASQPESARGWLATICVQAAVSDDIIVPCTKVCNATHLTHHWLPAHAQQAASRSRIVSSAAATTSRDKGSPAASTGHSNSPRKRT